ncbi:MAG TPA: hypothetical protein PLR99_33450 [Polyangiaceae bacterium]|nr:hypothetical protein [Polyangiaceae bacterium]
MSATRAESITDAVALPVRLSPTLLQSTNLVLVPFPGLPRV